MDVGRGDGFVKGGCFGSLKFRRGGHDVWGGGLMAEDFPDLLPMVFRQSIEYAD
jgi:hypothetical protein